MTVKGSGDLEPQARAELRAESLPGYSLLDPLSSPPLLSWGIKWEVGTLMQYPEEEGSWLSSLHDPRAQLAQG